MQSGRSRLLLLPPRALRSAARAAALGRARARSMTGSASADSTRTAARLVLLRRRSARPGRYDCGGAAAGSRRGDRRRRGDSAPPLPTAAAAAAHARTQPRVPGVCGRLCAQPPCARSGRAWAPALLSRRRIALVPSRCRAGAARRRAARGGGAAARWPLPLARHGCRELPCLPRVRCARLAASASRATASSARGSAPSAAARASTCRRRLFRHGKPAGEAVCVRVRVRVRARAAACAASTAREPCAGCHAALGPAFFPLPRPPRAGARNIVQDQASSGTTQTPSPAAALKPCARKEAARSRAPGVPSRA